MPRFRPQQARALLARLLRRVADRLSASPVDATLDRFADAPAHWRRRLAGRHLQFVGTGPALREAPILEGAVPRLRAQIEPDTVPRHDEPRRTDTDPRATRLAGTRVFGGDPPAPVGRRRPVFTGDLRPNVAFGPLFAEGPQAVAARAPRFAAAPASPVRQPTFVGAEDAIQSRLPVFTAALPEAKWADLPSIDEHALLLALGHEAEAEAGQLAALIAAQDAF